MSVTRVDFPEPDTPVTATNRPRGISTVRFFRLFARAPDDAEPMLGWRLSPARRDRNPQFVAEVPAGQRVRMAADVFDRALGHHLAAEAAGPGAQIDHVVRRLDGVLVVLHHDHRIPQISQASQRVQQPFVIPLVQADARLIEDVEHAHQPRADLGGQPDPLGLAARERGGASAEGQVIETHVAKKAEAIDHFLENRSRDVRIEPSPAIAG